MAPPDEATPLKKKKRRVTASRKREDGSLVVKKWIILVLCCLVMAAMYYILAMPAALHRQLSATMPTESFEMNFNLLFAVSYFPNMILPLFGGAVVDHYGEAPCLVVYCIIVLIGQTVTSFGISFTSWKLMLMGRFLFGLGAQNLIVANASLLSKWFSGSEGVAMGLSNVFSYGGVIATNVLSPRVANALHPASCFWLGVGLEAVAIAFALMVLVLDRTKKEAPPDTPIVCSPMFSPVALTHQHTPSTSTYSGPVLSSPGVALIKKRSRKKESTFFQKICNFKPTFWLLCASFLLVYGVVWSFTNVSSAILLERDFFLPPPKDCHPLYPNQCISGRYAPAPGNPFVDSQGNSCVIDSNMSPVIPTSLNMTTEDTEFFDDSTIITIDHVVHSDIQCHDDFWALGCTKDYCDDLSAATIKAGFYMSIPYFFTVALTSVLGVFVDKTGWRTEMICLGSSLLIVAHVLLAYRELSPLMVPLVSQGLGYTICVAALWPSVPFTVSPDSVGVAFGIMMGVQNVGLALIPIIVAFLFDKIGHDHYLPFVELFFAACSILATIVGVVLMMVDRKTDKILGTPKTYIRLEKEDEVIILNSRRGRSHSDVALMEKGRLLPGTLRN